MKVSAKRPYFTTFRRRVRRWAYPVSLELPFEFVQEQIRAELNAQKHTVIETTWQDQLGSDDFGIWQREVSVRAVAGGMRHGLGGSADWDPVPTFVKFARAHGLPRPAVGTAVPDDDDGLD